ncbi:TRAM domain-containing protein [Rhodococcus antarcticus]|uniref:TRAM domain-containing protein n=1 Tax=Rhodococcus antarcticus TaxID=2987751 RepID=A0ABY6P2P1_9NOCA|nr:TRAM domain-containing protein [Rhodococcus antarcticus]UZJ25912.1 TRAM domain-containing protein [Rhodococcus antarcticus]
MSVQALDWTGRELDLELGAVGHGGFCVARHEGRVVFVRHGLPGERVRAAITEDRGGSFCRADAVEVLSASADRVVPPCPVAGPGGCGGCDFQHARLPAQRRLKAEVVAEQLRRLGGLTTTAEDVVVEELPGGADGLGWRTRLRLAVGRDGRTGLHVHRSSTVIPLADCPQAVPGTLDGVADRTWSPGAEVAAVLDSTGAQHVVELVPVADTDGRRPRRGTRPRTRPRVVRGSGRAAQRAGGRDWEVLATGFWQGHTGAADVYADVVREWSAAPAGGTAWDLYGGVGLFASVLGEQVGPDGTVVSVESSKLATADGAAALADLPQVRFVVGTVEAELAELPRPVDVVVLDPPRNGAGRAVVEAVAGAGPARVVYVACDPAALGRDVALLAAAGYELTGLRAFDAFPMTHHVECIALFTPAV